ncbi:hypothetical protein [Micromonospora deserti]|uniref:Uncharacterized protein n=1 Tax=Micromonospora deserti TaxID=2070366 RepID=A0A2W2CYI9_9ACTN|nr:hypothetical protein [Micromonospora deserti]PZF92977.1 hypothetical protein C1I99_21155 [Micromonospora deserti]
MTWGAVLLVTAVVWAVSLIRSVRLRALVYSLPLPMTLALVTTGYEVDGAQLLGVLGLNLFFVTVALTHHRLRWPILLADLAGVGGYVALSAGLLAVPVPFEPALAGTVLLWLLAMAVLRRRARRTAPVGGSPVAAQPVDARRNGLPAPAKLVVIFLGAVLTALLGQLLRGMVVTFPYSGVLVAVEARHHLAEFSRHFARNSLALVGFLTAYHYLQGVSPAVALAAGWAAFGLVSSALHLPLRGRRRRTGAAGPPAAPAAPAARPGRDGPPAGEAAGSAVPAGGAPAGSTENGRVPTNPPRNEREARRPAAGLSGPIRRRDMPVGDDLGRGG